MTLALMSLGVISLLEVLLWLPPLRSRCRIVAGVLIVPLAVASGLLVGERPAVWTAIIFFLSVYRLINLLRIVEQRAQADYLFTVGRRSSWLLIAMQLAVAALAGWQQRVHLSLAVWLYILVASQLGCALLLLASTRRHMRTTRLPQLSANYAGRDLPTLTVAIPARNETDDLDACLQTLIASDYPKLEILVLDDCSQERRTPEIIRAFAHDGVRFISGQAPPRRWLAKNYAYKQLAAASSGDILLFCGVDVRFRPETLRRLVITLLQKKKHMLSLAPQNQLPMGRGPEAFLLQPVRYAWELALPRRLVHRPPVLSTCWLIDRETLLAGGGFEAVSRSISPESYFARQAAGHEDGYSFLHGDTSLGLVCLKSLSEQRATAVRTRYPQLHRRPELTAGLSLLELAWLIAPFALLIAGVLSRDIVLAGFSGLACALLLLFYAQTIDFTYQRLSWSGCWLLPLAALYDIMLLNRSMWLYEFNEVIWKDRNVCVPVMRAIPKLPRA